jgi:hypothetical protein
MFDLGDRLAMAQLEARVKELEKIEDANRATMRRLEEAEGRLEEENKWLREDKLVLGGHLVDLVNVCLRVRPVSLDGIGSDDFLAAIERAQSAVGEVE